MKEYTKAEMLYTRSITICKKTYGNSFSGLHYDYKGLLVLYQQTQQQNKVEEYENIISQFNLIC